jgi:hypothetical protein
MIDLSGKAVGNDLNIYSIKLVILCTYTPQRPVLCNLQRAHSTLRDESAALSEKLRQAENTSNGAQRDD